MKFEATVVYKTGERKRLLFDGLQQMHTTLSTELKRVDYLKMKEDNVPLEDVVEAVDGESKGSYEKYKTVNYVMADFTFIKTPEELDMFINGIRYFKNLLFNV